MTWIDWIIAVIPLLAVGWIGYKAHRYVHGVADFLAGGRVAGRYLLAVAGMESSLAVVSLVAACEKGYKSGFAIDFWVQIGLFIGMIMALSGFVTYRYRETRAMTLAQFFELRYSRKFRIFAGAICYGCGVLNYALFPVVSANFFLYYCNLPPVIGFCGFTVPTLGVLMFCFLGIAILILALGGQLSCMVTDCVQGLFSYAIFTIILLVLLFSFTPAEYETTLLARAPGYSFINPFDTGKLTDFNILFVLIGIFGNIYGRMAWQGSGGYNGSARTPHEQKMAGLLGTWRDGLGRIKIPLLVMSAYILMNNPDFQEQAANVTAILTERINLDNPISTETVRRQMLVPIALGELLPVGLSGAFVALMLMAMISTDTTYMQSWGSILIQDVILPIYGKPIKPRTQLWLLRGSIFFVALFAWCFGMFFQQVTYILHFFAMTGALWGGFAGSIIIGGLYWRRGTAAGAWASAIVGLTMGIIGFYLQNAWAESVYPFLSNSYPQFLEGFAAVLARIGNALPIAQWEVGPKSFPISGMEWGFLTMLSSITAYVLVSLATCREKFNLERMLHRGPYALKNVDNATVPAAGPKPRWYQKLVGINANYTRGDRFLAWALLGWNLYNLGVFLLIVGWNVLIGPWPDHWWFYYFYYYGFGFALLVGVTTTIWFSWGGIRDLRDLFRRLSEARENAADNGMVIGAVNSGEAPESADNGKGQ